MGLDGNIMNERLKISKIPILGKTFGFFTALPTMMANSWMNARFLGPMFKTMTADKENRIKADMKMMEYNKAMMSRWDAMLTEMNKGAINAYWYDDPLTRFGTQYARTDGRAGNDTHGVHHLSWYKNNKRSKGNDHIWEQVTREAALHEPDEHYERLYNKAKMTKRTWHGSTKSRTFEPAAVKEMTAYLALGEQMIKRTLGGNIDRRLILDRKNMPIHIFDTIEKPVYNKNGDRKNFKMAGMADISGMDVNSVTTAATGNLLPGCITMPLISDKIYSLYGEEYERFGIFRGWDKDKAHETDFFETMRQGLLGIDANGNATGVLGDPSGRNRFGMDDFHTYLKQALRNLYHGENPHITGIYRNNPDGTRTFVELNKNGISVPFNANKVSIAAEIEKMFHARVEIIPSGKKQIINGKEVEGMIQKSYPTELEVLVKKVLGFDGLNKPFRRDFAAGAAGDAAFDVANKQFELANMILSGTPAGKDYY